MSGIIAGAAALACTCSNMNMLLSLPIPVAAQSETQVCSRLNTGIAGSNPTEGIVVRLLCLSCVV